MTGSGRVPEIFVGERADALEDKLRQGYSPRAACKILGFSYDSYVRWIRCADEGMGEPYRRFAERMRKAIESAPERIATSDDGVFRSRGRKPREIDDFQRREFLENIRGGRTLRAAARRAGILYTTLCSWLRWGGYTGEVPDAPERNPVPEWEWRPDCVAFVRDLEEMLHARTTERI